MVKLTDLDKKILFELEKDGRVSYSTIAKNLATSPQVVKYHFEKLMENQVIKHFWAFIDYDRAGYSFFWGYWLKFSGLTAEQEEEMFQKLTANKFIPIIMRADGYADAMIGIIAKDVFHHNQILEEIFNAYGEFITMSEIVVGLGFIKFPRTFLIGQENSQRIYHTSGGVTQTTKLSETDRKILSLLQKNGRMEFSEMAKIINVSSSLVHRNYTHMVKQGVISKITFTLNYDVIGFKLYRVLFKLKQFDKKKTNALQDFCAKNKNIINYVKVMGNWQLMLDIEIESQAELRKLLINMKHDFNEIIFEIEVNEIYKIDKFTQMVIEYPDLMRKNEPEEYFENKEMGIQEKINGESEAKDDYWT